MIWRQSIYYFALVARLFAVRLNDLSCYFREAGYPKSLKYTGYFGIIAWNPDESQADCGIRPYFRRQAPALPRRLLLPCLQFPIHHAILLNLKFAA